MQHNYLNHAHAGPRGSTVGAVKTLREVGNNRKAPAGARASACRATLTRAYDLIQAGVIQHLLETLERLKTSSPQNND
jgi:hypothetical protein